MDVTVRFSKSGCLAELQGLRDVFFFLNCGLAKDRGPKKEER